MCPCGPPFAAITSHDHTDRLSPGAVLARLRPHNHDLVHCSHRAVARANDFLGLGPSRDLGLEESPALSIRLATRDHVGTALLAC